MNVLHICDYAAPYKGNFILELEAVNSALKAQGGKNIYAFTDRNIARKNKWPEELKESSPVYIYKSSPKEEIALFKRIIRDENIDIIQAHFTDMKTDLLINIATLGKKVKKFKHYRSSFGIWGKKKIAVAKQVYKNWEFICITPATSEECSANVPNSKNYIVLNPIAFKRLDKKETLDKKDIIGEENGTLCFMLGYDYKLKGIDLAAKAISELREQGENIHLGVAVSSKKEKMIADITEDYGCVPSWLHLLDPREDIASYYSVADICLSPSRSEGACSAIIEEAYCGKIVVASDCPGQKSYAEENLEFLWFENKNTESLKEKIKEAVILKDNTALIERNKKSAIKNYSLENYPEKILKIYNS